MDETNNGKQSKDAFLAAMRRDRPSLAALLGRCEIARFGPDGVEIRSTDVFDRAHLREAAHYLGSLLGTWFEADEEVRVTING